MIIADSDLASYLTFRTLAERAAKKAKVPVVEVADDSPTAAVGDVPESSPPDLSAAPRSSPQRNPQRSPQRSPQRKSGFSSFACRARLRNRPCADILILLVLCRGGAATAGAPGSRSRGAPGPAVSAKAELPGKGDHPAKGVYS